MTTAAEAMPRGAGSGWTGRVPAAARALAWAALIGMTGLLVRAEVRPPGLPEGVAVDPDLVYRNDAGRVVRLDLYHPEGEAPPWGRPAIVVIHGGGWRGGSKGDLGPMAARLASRGFAVASIDYTLSRPGRPSWPANREDVRAAVRWLRRHAAGYGIDPGRIAALGASAGGHLAALQGTDPGDPEARVQAVIDLYGPADLAALGGACRLSGGPLDLLLGGLPESRARDSADASPVRHVSTGTPPMFLIHGRDDPLIPPDQSERLAAALARAGVPHRLAVIPGAAHGFGLEVGARDLLPEILEFLAAAWDDNSEVRPNRSPGGASRAGAGAGSLSRRERRPLEIPSR